MPPEWDGLISYPDLPRPRVRSGYEIRDGLERRGTQPSYVRGVSAPRPNPLTFYVPLLTGKVPLPCYTGILFMHLVKTLHPFSQL